MRTRYAPVVIAGLALAACNHDTIKPDYRPVSMVPSGTQWIGPVTLIGDDQKFHIGDKAFLFRSGFTDARFSDSAVRVPQQDLFGDSLLALAAQSAGGTAAHLGDAMDLSCADEWDDFSRIMDHSGSNWFWTPGNHDGYFFGNFVDPERQWDDACVPSQPITKAQAIERYLTGHLAGYAGGALDLPQSSWSCPPDTSCHGLLRAAWSVRPTADYYTSYLIQEIDIPRDRSAPAGSLILVDTSTFDRPPRISLTERHLHLAAGETGGLGPAQLRLLEDWVVHAASQGRAVIVAGHHPYNAVDPAAQAVLSRLIEAGQVATYISAHTHWGQYFTHVGTQGYSWLEPNLGSIIDYDSEFGTLQLGFSGDSKFVRMARTPTSSFTAKERSDLGITCKNPEWLARPDDPDFYTRYKTTTSPLPTTVELLYYSTMLAALDRYWGCVPTTNSPPQPPGVFSTPEFQDCTPRHVECRPDPEVHAAVQDTLATGNLDRIRAKVLELLALDRTRTVDTCLRREYRVCQSLWGAEYEKRDYITPIKHEDMFEVHTAHRTVPAPRSTP